MSCCVLGERDGSGMRRRERRTLHGRSYKSRAHAIFPLEALMFPVRLVRFFLHFLIGCIALAKGALAQTTDIVVALPRYVVDEQDPIFKSRDTHPRAVLETGNLLCPRDSRQSA